MARVNSKAELLELAGKDYRKMMDLIDGLSEEMRHREFSFEEAPSRKEAHWKRDKNIRDILVHLYEWHRLFIEWVTANKEGEDRPFLPAPYNWRTYGEMNVEFWHKHQSTPYEEAVKMLGDSHMDVLEMIGSLTEAELMNKNHFTWTGTSTVGQYATSATTSHYKWAIKKIRLHIKSAGN